MIPTEILEKLDAKANTVAPIGGIMKFKLGDKVFALDGTGDKNIFSTEDIEADCTISMSEANFVKLTAGKLNPMMAVMSGAIKIKGDMALAMKLQGILG